MLYAIATVLVLILDQWLKYWVTTHIVLNTGEQALIPGLVSLVNIHNDGAAFGMLAGGSWRWVFVALAAVFVVIVAGALHRGVIRHPLGRWAAVGVLAGALGNCIDRVMQGYVVDMFRFDFTEYAIFNVADVFISCCGVLFILYIILGKDEAGAAKAAKGAKRAAPRAARAVPPPAPVPEEPPRGYVPPAGGQGRPYAARSQAPAPQPAPAPAADPFAEWEKPVAPAPGEPRFQRVPGGPVEAPYTKTGTAAPPVTAPPRAAAAPREPVAVGLSSPAAPDREPPRPAPRPEGEPEFSLEDILAEFSSK